MFSSVSIHARIPLPSYSGSEFFLYFFHLPQQNQPSAHQSTILFVSYIRSDLSLDQMGGLDRTPLPRPGGGAVPAPPRDGVTYSPDELEAMTEAQRLFLRVHPQFWLARVASEDSSDGNETFEAAALHLQSGKPPRSIRKVGSRRAIQSPIYLASPVATFARPMRRPKKSRSSMWSTTTWKSTLTEGFLGTSLQSSRLQGNRQAHPDVWHLAGIRLLQGKAYSDYKDSVALETDPLNWIDFCTWLEDLNPVTLSKQVVSDEYDALRMGNNESCQAFFDRFHEWQSRAKNYSFQYEEISGFVARLTKPLNNKLLGLMAVEDQRGTPMTFAQVVMAALDEDRRWRKTSTVASTNGGSGSGPLSNKRASTGGDSQPKKKLTAPTHCFNCGKEGHVVAKCPDPKTEKQKAYEAQKGKPVTGPLN
ncbi:hypothetical protein PCANC_25438 [Puccinia coronata f. sp. avenae]|uniref:CCHC-type domain-containing protein n=1 Tax=Puccinia coronata f. sp. avenae TaxID=200324 RepID=A0A2N5TMW5_9BASI|nr:hypothetical protein PCANC_25438 [Puccinia coronata f. sp. avenae]